MEEKDILQWLAEVEHPAKGDRNIVELGMVDSVIITPEGGAPAGTTPAGTTPAGTTPAGTTPAGTTPAGTTAQTATTQAPTPAIKVTLAFPRHRDPLAEYLIGSARAAVIRHTPEGTQVTVEAIVKEEAPKKKPGLDLGTEEVAGVRHIIGVASGKGGVGKSTVAVNLAVALARLGYRVGLADADVYGPSVPKMTGTEDVIPEAVQERIAGDGGQDGNVREEILPVEKYGVKWMSIGYFAKPEQALIWRGPMACNALKQMILQVRWGELDFLLIDMPPGTGDIHISLVHDIPFEGAVIVSTPQAVALADVEKGVNMFRNEQVGKTIFGLVENMSWFTPEELPDNRYYIFGKGGGEAMAKKYGIDLIGQVPLVQSIREGGDDGTPVALGTRPDGQAFLEIAEKLAAAVE